MLHYYAAIVLIAYMDRFKGSCPLYALVENVLSGYPIPKNLFYYHVDKVFSLVFDEVYGPITMI